MNDTIFLPESGSRVSVEVERFVASVRARFADLPAEEVEDLLTGLEADVADWVAEEGPDVLDDPVGYAAELRSAAGWPPYAESCGRATTTTYDLSPRALLDGASSRWARLLAAMPGDLGQILGAMRPAWWVFRAWVAVMVVSHYIGGPLAPADVPWLPTWSWAVGLGLLAAAAVGSVQIGRRMWWPGGPSTPARLVLLVLNAFAVAMAPQMLQQVTYTVQTSYYENIVAASGTAGRPGPATFAGSEICQIQPYDADGRPLTGVQLFDGQGRALNLRCEWDRLTPWRLGDVKRWNVFPQGGTPFPARAGVPAVTPPAELSDSGRSGATERERTGEGNEAKGPRANSAENNDEEKRVRSTRREERQSRAG